MDLKRALILLLLLLAVAAVLIILLVRRNDYYYNLAQRANQEIQEAKQKPVITVGPNDNRPAEQVIQNRGPATIVRSQEGIAGQPQKEDAQSSPPANDRDDKSNRRKIQEYYSNDRKLIAIEHFGEGGKLVRKDIYDDSRRVRLRQFYNTEGDLIYEETFNEKGKKLKAQPTMPIFPGRGIY